LTENTLSLKPGGLYKKTFDVSKVSPGSTNTVQPGTIYCPSPDFNNYTKSDVVNDTHSKHRYSSSFPAPVLVSEQNPPLYRPDPVLSKTVNPHLAPSLQLHGSASYKLKPTPQEFITQIDSNPTFKDNHYTHTLSVKEEAKGVSGSPLPVLDTVNISDISIGDFEPATSQGEEKVPKCQFLRDNFPSPEPISKDTLYHIEPSSIKPLYKPIVNSSTNFQPVIVSAAPSIPIASTVPISIASFPSHPHGSPGFTAPIAAASSLKKESFPQQSVNILTPRQPPPASSSTAAVRTMAGCNAMSGYSAANFMSGGHEMSSTRDIYTTVAPQSRVQEKEELQRLNDRFSAYVGRVRQLGQQTNHVDTSAFLRSTKILEDEILHLKSMYEGELDKLRSEIEVSSQEKHSLHTQCNKQHQQLGELQDRLNIEVDKTSKLQDEITVYQQKMTSLEAQVQEAVIAAGRPKGEVDSLHRNAENLTREVDQWRHRYDHEQVSRQQAEGRSEQMLKKLEFSEQVHKQQVADYQNRLDSASASILTLESKVRDLSTADTTAAEMLKQVRDTAEAELKKFQIESEEQYSRNLTALKAQIDNDAACLQRYQTEKSELMGSIGELQAKIRNLEGQVANLHHQKGTLEDAIGVERNRSADNISLLERRLRNVQDQLVIKMKEVTNAREANIPLKAEIEALKALMEEEEKRLRVPLGIVPASVIPTSTPAPLTTSQILANSPASQVIRTSTTNQILSTPPTSDLPQPCLVMDNNQISTTTALTPSTTAACVTPHPPLSSAPPCDPVKRPLYTTNEANQFGCSTVSALHTAPHIPSTTEAAAVTSAADNNTIDLTASYNYSACMPRDSGLTNPLYPYAPSPPLDTLYVPEPLQTHDEPLYETDYGAGVGTYDLYMQGFSLPMTGPQYHYETTPSLNRLQMDPSPPLTPKAVGPIRAQSAPAKDRVDSASSEMTLARKIAATREKNVNMIPANLGNGRDYFDEMFNDLQKDTLFSKPRPKSSPLEQRLPSTFHDYTVSTSSAIGDLKILEVNQDGKFVRLVNDGPTEFEFGGYMVQQNVGGHPVAVFRFPPRSKFPPDATITIWAAMNDPQLHNPPTDFFWKEQQKWGTGPECTTILCRANGQAVAWTTAAHRFTKDAFAELTKKDNDNNKPQDDIDNESLTELSLDVNGPRPEPVYLKREKQQPLTLQAPKHPHGTSPTCGVHPQTSQPRPLRYGNDNTSVNRQTRTQSTRPDPIPGQPYAGAPAQRVGSAPLRKMGSCQATHTVRGNGSLANKSNKNFLSMLVSDSPRV